MQRPDPDHYEYRSLYRLDCQEYEYRRKLERDRARNEEYERQAEEFRQRQAELDRQRLEQLEILNEENRMKALNELVGKRLQQLSSAYEHQRLAYIAAFKDIQKQLNMIHTLKNDHCWLRKKISDIKTQREIAEQASVYDDHKECSPSSL